jgi:preprotein translocase subunit SecD
MLQFSRFGNISIIAACLIGLIFALPNFFARETVDAWPSWAPKKQIPPGLDLQGGAHLLLAMDSAQLRRDWLQSIRDDARRVVITEGKIPASVTLQGNSVIVRPTRADQLEATMREARKMQQNIGNALLGTSAVDLDITRNDAGQITITPSAAGITQRTANAASAAIETINRRINQLGTAESSVVRQGADRILVQYPGLKDASQLKALIKETARLTFHEVHNQFTAEDAQQGRAPAGWRVFPSDEAGEPPHLLRETPVVKGEELVDAQPGFDQQNNQPIITFRFDQSGARKFGRFTQANVGRPFAIVLDGKVLSAPVIQTAILGGTGQISGNFTVDSANRLAVQLRSGALPVDMTIVEERTVGPSLGSDSIEAGRFAGIVGALATFVMVITAYGTFGIFAVIALIVNGMIIVALMSGIGITLTLPGIAGLVLTIGMAVDANVLIYERIREEIRAGKTAITAIETGFKRAVVTILDSQLTTLAAALLMFWLGSGPIRGFAVTLSIGIFTSIFSAVFVTRLLVVTWLKSQKMRPQKIVVPI